MESVEKGDQLKVTELENSVEVEDKEGNVMSEKDYIDLKTRVIIDEGCQFDK